VKASSVSLLVNLVSNFALAFGLIALGHRDVAHVGIAVSTALGGYTNAVLQWRWLRQKGVLELKVADLTGPLVKLLAACGAMAAVLVAGKLLVPFNVEWAIPLRLVWLATVGGLGALSFAAVVQWNGLMDVRQLLRDMRSRKPSAASVTFGGE
jgi:peptidoglycan biosynthesis protein MviN/MurJ (putative lipid II flippase)